MRREAGHSRQRYCRPYFVLSLLLGLVASFSLAGGVEGQAQAADALYPVVIETPDGGRHVYHLELAATPETRSRGLMHRKQMPEMNGMLFVWPDEQKRSFWMKNTPLSLDILFFSADRKLVSLHQDTTPFSEALLLSGPAARYVVELNAGQARASGLDKGSVLVLPDELVRRLVREVWRVKAGR